MSYIVLVFKVLILKILFHNIALNVGYEFGYNPSAEEFDNFMRETRRTWTRDLIANDRHRAWTKPRFGDFGSFVPKYSYERQQEKFQHLDSLNKDDKKRKWQTYVKRPMSSGRNKSITNLGSSVEFTLFADDQPDESSENFQTIHQFSATETHLPNSDVATTVPSIFSNSKPTPVRNPSTANMEFTENPFSKNHTKKNFHTLSPNGQFPIFFSNPATGIVYAITEVGQATGNSTYSLSNGHTDNSTNSIPIYITKAQYDRDVGILLKRLTSHCPLQPPHKLPSTSLGTQVSTIKPKIFHKPITTTVSKLPDTKVPVFAQLTTLPPTQDHHLPESNANGHASLLATKRPSINIRKKKKRKKTRHPSKRPGFKPIQSAPTYPVVVIGNRTSPAKPSPATRHPYLTQMEKPILQIGMTDNAPSEPIDKYSSPISRSGGEMFEKKANGPSEGISVDEKLIETIPIDDEELAAFKEEPDEPMPVETTKDLGLSNTFHGSPRLLSITKPMFYMKPSTGLRKRRSLPNSPQDAYQTKDLKRITKEIVSSKAKRRHKRRKVHRRVTNQTSTHQPDSVKLSLITTTTKPKLEQSQVAISPEKSPNSSVLYSNLTVSSAKGSNSSLERSIKTPASKNRKTRKRSKKPAKQNAEDADQDDDFSIFSFLSGSDDDDDSYPDDYDDEDEEYDEEHPVRPVKRPIEEAAVIEETTESSVQVDSDLKETSVQENSSSAEEGADFGALAEDDKNTGVDSKTTKIKKRIRRKPTASYEDYSDDDIDDGDDYNGVGGFFRMIFYPVEVVMTRIYDGFSQKNDEDTNKPKYPTYTMYHNDLQQEDTKDDSTDDKTSFFGDWLHSWFGFNRRTKKIGSAIKQSQQLPTTSPPPTKEPSWFQSWFGFDDEATAADNDEEDDSDQWFFGWFDTKPKARRRTTTTTSTTPSPQHFGMPILTIVDPLKNPQSWMGILAHHIVNSTSFTTHNPLLDALTRATTENPDIPREISYDKYQIWRLKFQDETQVRAIEEYKRSEEGIKLRWLKGPTLKGLTDVLVSPKMLIDFQNTLSVESIDHEVLIFDVGKAISYEQSKTDYYQSTTRHPRKNQTVATTSMSWHKYHTYDDIIAYLELVRLRHPQIVELIHIGRSYEGRPLVVVKIESKQLAAASTAAALAGRKKLKYKKRSDHYANAVFIESGVHGLEWIGPATSTWMINELVHIMKSSKLDDERDFVKNFTWYIMPVLNPDGYVYSHQYDRFWKKSRSRHISRPGGFITTAMTWLQQKKASEKVCYGVDLDRNWHYQWGKRGSSKSPCNEFFSGPLAFSEPETKALSEFLMEYRKQIKLFLSLQAYGQIISYPLKFNSSYNSDRMDDFLDVAMVGTDDLRKRGSKSRYKIDSTNDLIENRSGSSDAFAAYDVGIPFSYTIQLADNGVHGYLLPSSSIESTARDAFQIASAMVDYI